MKVIGSPFVCNNNNDNGEVDNGEVDNRKVDNSEVDKAEYNCCYNGVNADHN